MVDKFVAWRIYCTQCPRALCALGLYAFCGARIPHSHSLCDRRVVSTCLRSGKLSRVPQSPLTFPCKVNCLYSLQTGRAFKFCLWMRILLWDLLTIFVHFNYNNYYCLYYFMLTVFRLKTDLIQDCGCVVWCFGNNLIRSDNFLIKLDVNLGFI